MKSTKEVEKEIIRLLKPFDNDMRRRILAASCLLLNIPLNVETDNFVLVAKEFEP